MSRVSAVPRRHEVPRGATLEVRQATTHELDPARAAAELRDALLPRPSLVVFFCAPTYDRAALGAALARSFEGVTLVGCTSAGQIDAAGFQRDGITALAIASESITAEVIRIDPLSRLVREPALAAIQLRHRRFAPPGWRTVALALVDGLSYMEERLASALHECLNDVPLVGGSAADGARHAATGVFVDGAFRSDCAAVVLLHTCLDFATFQFHHFEPGGEPLVITEADPTRRRVVEINGEPAALAYARALRLDPGALGPDVFADHPLLLNLGGEYIARSIRAAGPGGALAFYCAIEAGLVARVGNAADIVDTTRRALARVTSQVGELAAVIGIDFILRRVELEHAGLDREMGALYGAHHVVGLSSYGEQFNGIHANHTFTGIALGRPR